MVNDYETKIEMGLTLDNEYQFKTISVTRDWAGNFTVKDSETGKSVYFQGGDRCELHYLLNLSHRLDSNNIYLQLKDYLY